MLYVFITGEKKDVVLNQQAGWENKKRMPLMLRAAKHQAMNHRGMFPASLINKKAAVQHLVFLLLLLLTAKKN